MFVAYPPCEGWLSSGQLSDQQSSPWLCSLGNKLRDHFEGSGNLCRCFELIIYYLIGMSPYSNLLRLTNSPDLKPIENQWVFVKRKMRNRRPKNADELKATVKETWASIPPQQCHKLITSMPRRIEAVIKAKGAPNKYWVYSAQRKWVHPIWKVKFETISQ